ncbi:MAG: UDP-N-acetylmuramate dehydrogenase [Acidobacteria bacterium]|nr:UDP-N-acetylmuramate dehydrogenase [Acidobacteriota bacterium]
MDLQRFDAAAGEWLGFERLRADVPLATLTTFRVGGPADRLAEVRTIEELTRIVELAASTDVPLTLLGGGSNVVAPDEGIRGVVVRLNLAAITQPSADAVRAEAGATINGLVRWTVGRGLAGLEAWAGTPGTVGGAIHGNAHWAGRNIGDLVRRVMVLSRDGRQVVIDAAAMDFGYDSSRLQRSGEIAVWAEFTVRPGDPETLRATARASLAFRKRTQPLAAPSAGCVFQNPDPDRDRVPPGLPASAGALVDRAGLKGFRVGGASISDRHANFVVNDGTATAADVRAVVEAARRAVRERFGVVLRDEVVWLGRS